MTSQNKNSEFIFHLTNARMDKKDAIDHLTNIYIPQVREYIATHKEEDLDASVKKVFTTAFEQLQTFRGDSADFAAFLYKIIHKEITLDLLDIADFITAEHHKALSLNVFFGLSYEQIAKMSNSTSSHVQNLATQATQQLINQKNRASVEGYKPEDFTPSKEIPEIEETPIETTLPDAHSSPETTHDDVDVEAKPDDSDSPKDIFSDVALTQTSEFTEVDSSLLVPADSDPGVTPETPQVAPDENNKRSKKKFLLLLSALTLVVIAGAAAAYVVWNENYRTTATGTPETTAAPSTSLDQNTTSQPPTTPKFTTVANTTLSATTTKATIATTTTSKPTTSRKSTTTRKPTTTAKQTTTTATTSTPVQPAVAPPQSCEVQLWDDFDAGIEVLEPKQNFRPNYIFYNAKMEEVRQTKDLRPPQRDDPQELEWIAITNGFRTTQVFYVAASDGTNISSPVLCQRVS